MKCSNCPQPAINRVTYNNFTQQWCKSCSASILPVVKNAGVPYTIEELQPTQTKREKAYERLQELARQHNNKPIISTEERVRQDQIRLIKAIKSKRGIK